MPLFKRKPKPPTPDQLYGTGLWRQHRDRFNRAVDRFYATAAALHEESAHAPQAETLAQQTLRLNELSTAVDSAARAAQAAFPTAGMVLPSAVRSQVGQLPELLSRAALKTAEAAQAAAMTRAYIRAGPAHVSGTASDTERGDGDAAAATASAVQYVDDAERIVAECTRLAVRL